MNEHHRMRFAFVLAAALGAALALAACGGSSKSSSTSSIAASTGTTSSTATATGPATSSTSSITTTTTAGPAQCRAGNLALSFLGQQGATGHGELGFALRNTSGVSCRTFGYPGILFLDKAGRALPTIPTHTTRDFFGTVPEVSLVVAPGAHVSFRLGVTHGATSQVGCTTAYGLQVIPPNDTATLRTAIAQGAYECQTATVSPLRADDGAYP